LIVLGLVSAGDAQAPREREPGDPVFVAWLQPGDPFDETIYDYWQRAKHGELDAAQTVDLGTMLFHKGYPDDALPLFRQVVKADSKFYEAWFRIGLVKHFQGDMDDARQAYRKALKRRPGHGWCNFYLGLLEEQTNHPSKALEYYQLAFKHAPELAELQHNPALMYSRLQLGAQLVHIDRAQAAQRIPLAYLRPGQVERVRSRFEPTRTPTPTPRTDAATDKRANRTMAPAAADAAAGTASGMYGTKRPAKRTPTRRPRRRPSGTPGTGSAFGIPAVNQPTQTPGAAGAPNAQPTPTP
jgi:tetratricopeptide (TPR) repeat protein